MGLDLTEQAEREKDAVGNVAEEKEVSEAEEEWPSVGLERTEKAEGETAAGGNVVEEVEVSESEEEGLPLLQFLTCHY